MLHSQVQCAYLYPVMATLCIMLMQDLLRQGAIVNMADKYGVTPLLACVDGAMSRRIPTDSEPSASNVAQDGASSSTSICDSNLATVQVCIHLTFTCLLSRQEELHAQNTLLCWLMSHTRHMCLTLYIV